MPSHILYRSAWFLPAGTRELTRSKCEGGVEAMVAEQNAARKPANAALAAVRTSAAAATPQARPVAISGKIETPELLFVVRRPLFNL